MGGAPDKIYLTLMKMSGLKKFEKNPLHQYDAIFYIGPRVILNLFYIKFLL